MRYRVKFHPGAKRDLDRLGQYVSENSGAGIAHDLLDALTDYCLGLSEFPVRGTGRSDLAPGLRLLGYRKIATIIYRINGNTVIILRIVYRGQDVEGVFRQNKNPATSR